jgi:hypothetical protein
LGTINEFPFVTEATEYDAPKLCEYSYDVIAFPPLNASVNNTCIERSREVTRVIIGGEGTENAIILPLVPGEEIPRALYALK